VLSWVLVVVAGLLTAQALGINIKPLLAVGESAEAAAVTQVERLMQPCPAGKLCNQQVDMRALSDAFNVTPGTAAVQRNHCCERSDFICCKADSSAAVSDH
jgi:hypothetical protein